VDDVLDGEVTEMELLDVVEDEEEDENDDDDEEDKEVSVA
jgi:hypothetical protein